MTSCGLFSVGVLSLGLDGAAYGAATTMQTAVLFAFILSNGVRKYLLAIIGIPLVLTLVGILVCCTPTRVELTLFYTPFITAICVVVAGASQARMAMRSFRMSRLVELHKDELEDKAEALQLANNELQQFASAVAHDLKVPLHSIRTALQMMDASTCEDKPGNAAISEQMEFVTGTADRMSQMIASMLSYACLENCSDQFRSVPLDEVLKTVRLTLKHVIEESGAEIVVDPLPEVWGDRMQLTMLLQEFFVNAIKYHKPGVTPSVTVASEDAGDDVRILVSDNGIGFDAKHRRTVFRPYQQLQTHAREKGSGIGLASCAKIVKLHGGTIGVNPIPDQGSTFYFTLSGGAPS
jgi:light-regulated signal transduction histidine kinase (bacteriophytochrome)